ncbi:carbohydrate ABC transporter substrate-binding protein, CUT1 family [Micromonospora sediminicola]|uniref:Carbohydrate ABC transporter substrate-binding protein, CUT1 family n=1 Tax=Micromonospora sediminicola TaxID=946078 RepID=A0A1A9BGX2_9ACTN|nr:MULTISPECIES: extracellular solute-binding protein [Micromonospora]PGH46159.1 ABC transporter substrate-binding protein [Micromonospora sp. WMMA1996]SBT68117.1 carbohydrate ABC transporter substrate-binding protein, CUT1 family [Micromonospora sediminicola]
MTPRTITRAALAGVAAVALLGSAACGSGFDDSAGDTKQSSGPASLQILIGSSGDAETKAVQEAAAKWAGSSGNTATVTPAQDLTQQLGQALAGGTPPDVFYVDAARFADFASVGALEPYGDKVSNTGDFYESLRTAFTYDGKLYCAPKDFSTLALQINTDLWTKAGLTDADVPTTWDQLTAVSQKIKAKGQVALALGDTRDRIGAFLVQNGGWLMSADGKQPTADTPENLQALQYVKSLLTNGYAKFPKQLDSGWSGEAFGKGKAVMTIEGNWIKGALQNDFPKVKYKVVPLPAGPKGQGTLSFTQCWGIAAKSKYKEQAIKFVEAMTAGEQQMAFAKAFGVMPSRQSVSGQYTSAFPADKPFIDGAAYAQGPVNAPKMDSVLRDLEAGLQGLATGDPKTILANFDKNAKAALGG